MKKYIDTNYKFFPTMYTTVYRKELTEYMKGWNACLRSVLQQPAADVVEVKREAIKEFAEKLKQKFNVLEYEANTTRKTLAVDMVERQMDWVLHEVTTSEIDNLVKEMAGEE